MLLILFSAKEDQIDCYVGWLLIPNFPNIWHKYRCVCVCVCVCVTLSTKLSPRKKKLDVHINVYFVGVFFFFFFLPVFCPMSNKYIIRSVKQVESMQRNLTESRSLNWERIARHQKAVTSFSYLST